jgi:hypothetical protein
MSNDVAPKRPRVRMRLDFDGEPTEGVRLVERLLLEGHKQTEPLDRRTAESAIEALELLDLPWVFGEMVEGGEKLAEQIHSHATRGLQEIVQNAEDQGAKSIRFAVRQRAGIVELLMAHDGSPVLLHDVVLMAYPLLSGSRREAEKIGRFGIGLKTLNQFGDRLEVHCPPLPGFEIHGGRIRQVTDAAAIPGFWDPGARETLFLLRLRDSRFDLDFFRNWVEAWDASSLVFLRHLRSIALVDLGTHRSIVRHAVSVTKRTKVELSFPRATESERLDVRDAASRRRWTVYRARYPVSRDVERVNKAIGTTIELAVATSNRQERQRIYAGLPLEEPWTLAFGCSAPFDINVDRTSLLDNNALNEWLLARLGDLVAAAAEDTFARRPKEGWGWIPLKSEGAGEPGSWLHATVGEVCQRVRKRVEGRVLVAASGGAPIKLPETLIEAPSLTDLFDADELERLDIERLPTSRRDQAAKHVLPDRVRDGVRWRRVLADVDGPRSLSVPDALVALEWPPETLARQHPDWAVQLVAAAIDAGAGDVLLRRRWVSFENADERHSPKTILSSGQLVVSRSPKADLASTLGQVAQLAPAFRGRSAAAVSVREWLSEQGVLHERVTDALALKALAGADGTTPIDLSKDPALVRRLRDAFEHLPATDRDRLGPGIGRNVALAGYEYTKSGRRYEVIVRPADAYIPYRIEKVEGWPTAAGKAPGIRWLDDRYGDELRTSRKGAETVKRQGALAFLRAIGAAVAPRLQQGVSPNANPHAELPRYRLSIHQLDELRAFPRARTLLDDWDSPDMNSALQSITSERAVGVRRKRARALFQCLSRAWSNQYAGRDVARAAHHYYSWSIDGLVSATWVGRLASEPWLSTREPRFTPKAPRDLAILTDASFEIEGERAERYANELGPADVDSPLVEAIGIEGKPSVETIINRLEDMRATELGGGPIRQSWVDRCYKALSAYCPGGRHENDADISRTQWRSWFGTGSGKPGLLRVGGEWLSIPDVRQGAYLGERVPWVGEPAALWQHLEVPVSDARDCRRVMTSLATDGVEDQATEVLVLRRLIELAGGRGLRKQLEGMPLNTYSGWGAGKTPVYAVRSRTLAAEMGAHWPVWKTPLSIDEVLPLLPILGVSLIRDDEFERDVPSTVVAANDLQADFPVVVTHLKNYLVLHNNALHGSIAATSWNELMQADVAVGLGWTVKAKVPGRRAIRISPRAHVFQEPLLFCAIGIDDAGAHNAGGAAIASYLLGDSASEADRSFIALAWESAFGRRNDREDVLDVDAPPGEEESDAGDDQMPNWLRGRSSTRRRAKAKPRRTHRVQKDEPRTLVDLETLDMSQVAVTVASDKRSGRLRYPSSKPLVDPKKKSASGKKSSAASRAGNREYTATDREDTGYAIAEAYLREVVGLDLEDVRDQDNVGADAVDRKKDIWVELKVSGRDRDDVIKLERSEAKRAQEKGKRYWLVVVWNLERPRSPELLLVQDPLSRLDTYLGNGIRLAGLNELATEKPGARQTN